MWLSIFPGISSTKKNWCSLSVTQCEKIAACGSAFGFSGPLGLGSIKRLVDEDILAMNDFVVGANKKDHHLTGVQFADILKDAADEVEIGDYRLVIEGDEAEVDGRAVPIEIKTAIELGHIFKLNLRYSEPLKANFLDEKGRENHMIMGCYGVGVNRIIAAAIEQASSEKGILWPSLEISPFHVLILTTNMSDEPLRQKSEEIYQELVRKGVDVLWDERDISAGIKFNDADLLGIPIRLTLGPRGLKAQEAEVKNVKTGKVHSVPLKEVVSFVESLISKLLSETAPDSPEA